MNKVYLTLEAKNELEARLKLLKVEGRADMADKIRQAREYGDLSENAEYDIAKEEQAKMEAEIIDIEAKLANYEIIEENVKSDVVVLGSQVTLLDKSTDEKDTYMIVGSHESDPMEHKLSNESPIGRQLMGKKVKDTVIVDTTSIGGIKSEFVIVKLG
ncbi:MAG: transcription elongation factor GreA [Firmicutes bacterium]|nr:transcription elongation factor GreA [Bacillota bacterium]MCL1953866.1 transcription elongation factor GreA [Bacillota bacterium]